MGNKLHAVSNWYYQVRRGPVGQYTLATSWAILWATLTLLCGCFCDVFHHMMMNSPSSDLAPAVDYPTLFFGGFTPTVLLTLAATLAASMAVDYVALGMKYGAEVLIVAFIFMIDVFLCILSKKDPHFPQKWAVVALAITLFVVLVGRSAAFRQHFNSATNKSV
jgi:hypothetical protein